ncbi:Cytochrome P450 87A3 [Hordeum vulgare]|nr:Cytochrome P450 87A3 [Hordeum vulgare]
MLQQLLEHLHVGLRIEFVEKSTDRLPVLPDEASVSLHIGLIMDGLQDGLLPCHLLRLSDGELRLRMLHVEGRSRRHLLLRLLYLHWSRMQLLSLLLLHMRLLLLLWLLSLLRLRRVWRQPDSNAGDAPFPDLLPDLVPALRRKHGIRDDLRPDHGVAGERGKSVGERERGDGWARAQRGRWME